MKARQMPVMPEHHTGILSRNRLLAWRSILK